jgi:hypothetical protein
MEEAFRQRRLVHLLQGRLVLFQRAAAALWAISDRCRGRETLRPRLPALCPSALFGAAQVFLDLPCPDPHDMDRVAGHVGGTLLTLGASGHTGRRLSRKRTGVSDSDEYRKQAKEARQMAAKAVLREDQVFWLRMAEDWAKLAQAADERSKGR